MISWRGQVRKSLRLKVLLLNVSHILCFRTIAKLGMVEEEAQGLHKPDLISMSETNKHTATSNSCIEIA